MKKMITIKELQKMADCIPHRGDWVVVSRYKDTHVPGGRGPLFWRPDGQGYTDCLLCAGVYEEGVAKKIAKASKRDVQAIRIGLNEEFLTTIQRFGYHVLGELAAIYKLEALEHGEEF